MDKMLERTFFLSCSHDAVFKSLVAFVFAARKDML